MVSMTTLCCLTCGKEFKRRTTEHKRNIKLGRRVFCSLKCSGKVMLDNIPEHKRCQTKHLIPNNRRDEYSPFRWFLKNC